MFENFKIRSFFGILVSSGHTQCYQQMNLFEFHLSSILRWNLKSKSLKATVSRHTSSIRYSHTLTGPETYRFSSKSWIEFGINRILLVGVVITRTMSYMKSLTITKAVTWRRTNFELEVPQTDVSCVQIKLPLRITQKKDRILSLIGSFVSFIW